MRSRRLPPSSRPDVRLTILALSLVAAAGCGEAPREAQTLRPPEEAVARHEVIVIGDIDPDTPARRIRHLQPLADHLAERLADQGIRRGEVVIARSIDELCGLIEDGSVDLYSDSIFPSMMVHRRTSTELVLKRAVRGDFSYHSVILVRADSGLSTLEDLSGHLIAFQAGYSTSGYLLPAAALRGLGLELVSVDTATRRVSDDAVGYFFADEENTITLLLDGLVDAGAFSSRELEEIPTTLRKQLEVLYRSAEVPRQLFSASPLLEPSRLEAVHRILVELNGVTLGDERLPWEWSFSELSDADVESLALVAELARDLEETP